MNQIIFTHGSDFSLWVVLSKWCREPWFLNLGVGTLSPNRLKLLSAVLGVEQTEASFSAITATSLGAFLEETESGDFDLAFTGEGFLLTSSMRDSVLITRWSMFGTSSVSSKSVTTISFSSLGVSAMTAGTAIGSATSFWNMLCC